FLVALGDEPEVKKQQLHYLREQLTAAELQPVEALLRTVTAVPPTARLALVELSVTALRFLSDQQYRDFRTRLQKLVDADQQVSYFEYALLHSLERHLAGQF